MKLLAFWTVSNTALLFFFREHYQNYKNTYKRMLLSPHDTELKLDLQVLEDQLGILDIVIAREHAKIEVCCAF